MVGDDLQTTESRERLAGLLEERAEAISRRWAELLPEGIPHRPGLEERVRASGSPRPEVLVALIERLRSPESEGRMSRLLGYVERCHAAGLVGKDLHAYSEALLGATQEALQSAGLGDELGSLQDLLRYELAALREEIADCQSVRLFERWEEIASRLAAFMEHTNDAVLVVEPARGRITETNPAASRLTGYPAGRLRAMKLSQLCPNCDDKGIRTFLAEVVDRGTASFEGMVVRHRDGQEIPCVIIGSLVGYRDAPGVLCLLRRAETCEEGLAVLEHQATSLASEISAQVLENQRLKIFFENVLAALPLRIVVLNSSLQVLHANPAFCMQLGLSQQDVIGKPLDDVFPDELLDVAGLRAALLSVLETGERVLWSRYRDAAPHRGQRMLNIRIDPCEGPDGDRTVLVTLEDITERHSQLYENMVLQQIARAMLGELNLPRLLHAILVGMTAGGAVGLGFNRAVLLLVDEEAGVLRAEMAVGPESLEEAVRIWREVGQDHRTLDDFLEDYDKLPPLEQRPLRGLVERLVFPLDDVDYLPMAAVVAHETVHVIDAEMDERVRPELREILETDEFVVAPLVAREKVIGAAIADNRFSERPIDQASIQLLTALADMAALAIDTARTYQRAREHAEKLDQALRDLQAAQDERLRNAQLAAIGEVTAIVAHEIRSPLAAIGGFARSILREPEALERNARSAKIIVDEVARLENILGELLSFSKPSTPRFTMLDLAPVITSLVEQTRQSDESHGVTIVADIEPGVPPVRADEKQVRQILLNLIKNALQAMPQGGLVTVGLRNSPQGVAAFVQDTGEGIPADRLARIFDAFYTSKPTGTGLGLALCKRLAAEHGADLKVESEQGKGTTFTLVFPPQATMAPEACVGSDTAQAQAS